MDKSVKGIFEGINGRKENIYLFFPLFQIGQSINPKYKNYDLMDIALGILLFTLEKMLSEAGGVTMPQITRFLQTVMKERYGLTLNSEEADEFRKYIVNEKLRNKGAKFEYSLTNQTNREPQKIYFELLRNDDKNYERTDKNDNRLILTDKGIEFLFKTKEIFTEVQITITMIFFKQQLEKGAFSAALGASKDLLFQINNQISSMRDYKEKVKKNILNEFNKQDLVNRLRDTMEQTKKEMQQLEDIQIAVESVKANYQAGTLSKKERKAYDTVLSIDRVLVKCSTSHEQLFSSKQDLIATINDSLAALIENAFSKRFHIEREVLRMWVPKEIGMGKSKGFIKPLMPRKKPELYNPFSIFEPQLTKRRMSVSTEEIITMDEEEREDFLKKIEVEKRAHYEKQLDMVSFILMPLLKNEQYLISDIINQYRKYDIESYVKFEQEKLNVFFYMSVALHRSDYRKFEVLGDEDLVFASEEARILAELTERNRELIEIEEFEMIATERNIEFANGETMTDYIIRRKEVM